jgi:hypothetical protein
MRTFRRTAVLVLLALILAAPWAAALEARSERVSNEATREAQSPLDLVHSFWNLLAGAWSKEGCRIDPLGLCVKGAGTAPQPPTSKSGCTMERLGGCRP